MINNVIFWFSTFLCVLTVFIENLWGGEQKQTSQPTQTETKSPGISSASERVPAILLNSSLPLWSLLPGSQRISSFGSRHSAGSGLSSFWRCGYIPGTGTASPWNPRRIMDRRHCKSEWLGGSCVLSSSRSPGRTGSRSVENIQTFLFWYSSYSISH